MRLRGISLYALGLLSGGLLALGIGDAVAGGPGMQRLSRIFFADDVVLKKGGETNLIIHADGDAATDDATLKFRMNNTSPTVKFSMGVDAGDSDKFKIEAADGVGGATPALTIDGNGNAGIGTSAPGAELHVDGGADARMLLGYDDGTAGFGEYVLNDETSGNMKWSMGAVADSHTTSVVQNAFYVYQYRDKAESVVNAWRMVIDDSGNVGLGTNAPVARLTLGDGAATTYDTMMVINTSPMAGAAGEPAWVIQGDENYERLEIQSLGGGAPSFQGAAGQGTLASPTATSNGQTLFQLAGRGWDNAGTPTITNNRAIFRMEAEEAFTTSAQGTRYTWSTTAPGTTSTSEKMRLSGEGYLGIGTTNPLRPLEIYRNDASVLGNLLVSQDGTGDASIDFYHVDDSVVWTMGVDNSDSDKFKISNDLAGADVGVDTRLTIDASGNVGIGTTAPEGQMHISAEDENSLLYVSRYGTTGTPYLVLYGPRGTKASPSANQDGDFLGGIAFQGFDTDRANGSLIQSWSTGEWGTAGDSTDGPSKLTFHTTPDGGSPLERMVIGDDGFVGIGTTDADVELHVTGATQGSLRMGLEDTRGGFVIASGTGTGSTEGGELRLEMAADYDTTYDFWRIDTWQDDLRIGRQGVADDIYINAAGNVGIGTSTITTALQVSGTVTATAFVGDGSGLTGISASGWTDGGTDVTLTTSTDQVGIGVGAPNDSLDVAGSTNVFHVDSTGLSNAVTNAAPYFEADVDEVTLFLGSSGSTSAYTADQSSGNLRFNGSGVAWGDFGYYPTGGDVGENGHFRFSLAGTTIDRVPDAKVGVGSLYSAGNLGIGTNGPTADLHLWSNSDVAIYLEADADNVTESDNPFIKFAQDGAAVTGIMGLVGGAGVDPEAIAYTGTLANSMLIGGTNTLTALHLGTNDAVRMTIATDGNVGVGSTAPDELLNVNTATAGAGAHIGAAFVGNWSSNSAYATFGHDTVKDTSGSYAVLQHSSGATYINAATEKTLNFRINNVDKMHMASTGNVAIGNTNPTSRVNIGTDPGAYSNPSQELTVYHGTVLGSSANDLVRPAELRFWGTNANRLLFMGHRRAAGGDWTTAGWRIQSAVDNSFTTHNSGKAYLELYNGNNGRLYFGTAGADRMQIDSAGNVSIGTTSTNRRLFVYNNSSYSTTDATVTFENAEDSLATGKEILDLEFSNDSTIGTGEYWIRFLNVGSLVGGVNSEVTYNTFTGAHVGTSPEDNASWKPGMIMVSLGNPSSRSMGRALVEVGLAKKEYDPAVIGVYTGSEEEHIHKGLDRDRAAHNYNALGEGLILVTDLGGDLRIGDYITSSGRAGYGMRQADDILHNYTVAKATESVNWDEVEVDPETGFKWALVACTYHGG